MSEVTAEVVESPKPVRPELWLVVYESGPRDDRSWFTDVYPNEAMATEALQGRLGKWPTAFIATVPASTAAPEPDWVAELCAWRDGGGAPAQIRMEQSTDGSRTGIHVHIRCRNTQIYKEGPTPNLAARACVEKLRAGGAT